MGNQLLNNRDRLGVFLGRVEALTQCRYVREPTPGRWSIKWERGKQFVTTITEPPEEVLKAFILEFRPFMLKNEPAYLFGVYNICEKCLQEPKLKEWLRMSRRYWKEAHAASGIRLNVDGRDYQPEEIADLWINGRYFHNEPKKFAELEKLERAGLCLDRMEFLHFLDRGLQQILYTGNVVKAGLKEGLFRFE